MDARPAAGFLVSALIRRVEAEGGNSMVLAKGDATAGAILILLADRGVATALLERSLGVEGYAWRSTGPADPAERDDYIARRRRGDPDLWVVEVDSPQAEAIVRDMMG
jgi:hypothetical protein